MNGALSTTVNPNWTYAQSPTNWRNTVYGMGVQSRQFLDNTQNFLKNNVKPSANVFAQNFIGFPCVPLKPCKVQINITGKWVKHDSLRLFFSKSL